MILFSAAFCEGQIFFNKMQASAKYQGWQIFIGTHTKMGENIPNDHLIYQLGINYTDWPQKDQMSTK
jgi:hypothetical protein